MSTKAALTKEIYQAELKLHGRQHAENLLRRWQKWESVRKQEDVSPCRHCAHPDALCRLCAWNYY